LGNIELGKVEGRFTKGGGIYHAHTRGNCQSWAVGGVLLDKKIHLFMKFVAINEDFSSYS
jgi:hypothetical protein